METSSPTTTSTPSADSVVPSPADELTRLRSEVERLQGLIGPSEKSYRKLQLDVLGARDAAIAAEAELGYVRGQVYQVLAVGPSTQLPLEVAEQFVEQFKE